MSVPTPVSFALADLAERVGQVVAVSPWFTVTQAVIDRFAAATLDTQWIHVDPDRATRESPFRDADGTGRTVAHGFLTLGLLSHLREQSFEVTGVRASVNVGFERVRFTAPVLVDSRIRAQFKLAEAYAVTGGTQFVWNVTMEREGSSRPVLVADWLTRVVH